MPSIPPRRDRSARRPGGSGSRPGARDSGSAAPRRPSRLRDPLVGKTLGGCEILERIASDGACTTYKANQAAMARLVALKVLSPEVAADEARLARFHETAKFAAQLHHPNIASIYDASSADNVHFSTQEYVEGRSLGEIIRAKQRLATSDALRVAVDVAEAHRFANAKGMPGLTISAERIFLTSRGEVKLLPPTFTPAGAPVLTDAYLLPALGVLLYAMLTGGRVPDLEAALEAGSAATAQLPRIKTVALGLRQDVTAIVDRLLGAVPESPYLSSETLIGDLRRLLEAQEKVENRTRTATERAQERQKHTLLILLLAGGACAVVLLIVVIALLSRRSDVRTSETEFSRARSAAEGFIEQAKRAQTEFAKAPNQATADQAIALLGQAKETYRQFQAAHAGDAKATEAGFYVSGLDDAIQKFRETVQVKMRFLDAQRRLKEVNDSIEADVADKVNRGGKIDVDPWRARYTRLANETRDVGGMADAIAARLRGLPNKAEAATLRMEANQLMHDFTEKHRPRHEYGKAIETWRAFRRKYDDKDFLRNQAAETADKYIELPILRDARAQYGIKSMQARDHAEKREYAKAREIYEYVIKNFGIPEFIDKATDALGKLPKE